MRTFLTCHWSWYLLRPWEFVVDLYREGRSFVQRGSRGYADSDLWSLDWYLRRILAKGLRRLSATTNSYPAVDEAKTYRDWTRILARMANGFQDVIDYEECGWEKDKNYSKMKLVYKKEEESLRLLAKWFGHLWD